MSLDARQGAGPPGGQEDGYFRQILETSPDAVWVLTPEGVVEYMNSRCRELTAKALSSEWREYWPEENRFAVDRAVAAAARGETFSFRTLASMADGARVYLDTVVSPVRGADGSIVRLAGVSKDVTRDVEQHAFFEAIIQLLPLPLTVKDAQTRRYVLLNRAAEDAFGVMADDAIGQTPEEIFPAQQAAQFSAEDDEVLASGEMRVAHEQPIPTSVTGLRYFTSKKLATYDDSGARHLISLNEDVTERRADAIALREALETAEQASAAKSVFLANMSHEIRTPLNGIVAGADMLSTLDLGERGGELVEMIRASGGTLERLLSDILDLVRIEAGQIEIEAAPFHLGDMLRSVAALSRLRADEKGLALEVAIPAELEGEVLGDGVRIRQVLSNLLSNAVKFTDSGSISLRAERAGETRARFTVADTGIGFDAQTKARIFGRFQQADNSFTRRFGGSGLGLAISRDLIALMDGVLDCDAREGEGAVFWFELELLPAQSTAQAEPASAAEPGRNLRVLVADDHPTNRKVVQLMLEGLADVIAVEDGQQAVTAFGAGGIDLVLMDMQMPVMDGLTAVRRIRRLERQSSGAPAPIIMLTANARPEHVAASQEAGADLHLEKPITSAALFGAINQVMAGSSRRRSAQ